MSEFISILTSTEIILGVITFLTSVIAAVVGIGGGMMLIAILPSFLPLNALIPVHGLTQVSSNISRAFFGYKDIQYEVIPKFLIGSVLGIGLFAGVLSFISWNMFHFLLEFIFCFHFGVKNLMKRLKDMKITI